MKELTPKQQEIYDFIVQFTQDNGYPPSVREIGQAVGLKSPSTVHFHIKGLESAGVLTKAAGKTRAMTLQEDEDAAFTMRDMERLQIRDILKSNRPPVRITVSMDDLVHSAMSQNFVPVIDDDYRFIGIITRKDIIRYLAEKDEVFFVNSGERTVV